MALQMVGQLDVFNAEITVRSDTAKITDIYVSTKSQAIFSIILFRPT